MSNPAPPKDAAAVILLDPYESGREAPLVYWVRRHPSMAFQGNFQAFPGGQREASDADVPVRGGSGDQADAMRVAAVRELFEETGVLVARGAEALDAGERREVRRRLVAEKAPFAELLTAARVEVDASLLSPAGRWVTPPFSPRRYDTWFFTAWLPAGQEVELWEGELDEGEWLLPAQAIAKWETGSLLVAPPILHAMRTLAGGTSDLEARFSSIPEARGGHVRRIEFRPGMLLFPVRTPTKPPATHTNCYLVGGRELLVIDPASPYEDEQAALDELIEVLVRDEGRRVREIVVSHLHPDHVGGVEHLRERLGVPVAAHRITAEALEGRVRVDRFVEDGERWMLEGPPDVVLRAVHTPGHARGHLCFFEERTRSLITADLIVGLGTVVIDPPEGNMADYLASLEKVRALHPTAIFGAHGPAIGNPIAKIDEYIRHRIEREETIAAAVRGGAGTPEEIVAAVYTDVPEKLHKLAARSVLAHLEKLEADGRVTTEDGRWVTRTGRA
jgi:glyoxylase-like metal-dependent hydrolase (beta-lactamase superfamily II)/8-oxo-dGTP pyrophosphatase MutT (NUDIX family)